MRSPSSKAILAVVVALAMVVTLTDRAQAMPDRNQSPSALARDRIAATLMTAGEFDLEELLAIEPSPPLVDQGLLADLLAATTDGTDTDEDGVPDVVEQALGTMDGQPDSDLDSVPDGEELSLGLDPMSEDSNGDGLDETFELDGPPDVDGDGEANAIDDDNDADGVIDGLDSSPFAMSAAASELHFDIQTDGEPTYVTFVVRPADPGHLALAGARWDWPADTEGQMQDLDDDGLTDDVVISPTLEILADAGPDAATLAQYGVALMEPNGWAGEPQEAWKAQVSLVPVEEEGRPVAFLGRMFYPAGTSPGEFDMRFAWRVTGATDTPSSTVLKAVTDFSTVPEGAIATNLTQIGSCYVKSGEAGSLTCADPLTGSASFKVGDEFRIYQPGAPSRGGTIDEGILDSAEMSEPYRRILIDTDVDLSKVPVGTLVTNTYQNSKTCFVERAETHRLICSAPGLPPGYSFGEGDTYTLTEPGTVPSPVLVGGTANDTVVESRPITLARYKEDFVLTGMDVTAHRGTDVAALASPDPGELLAMGMALDVEFGQTQRTIDEAMAVLETDYPAPSLRSATGTYAHIDEAMVGVAADLIPAVLDGLEGQANVALPAFVAVEERTVSAPVAEWDTTPPTPDVTSITVDLRSRETVVSKTVKLNWYDPETLIGADPADGLAEIDTWGLTEDELTHIVALTLFWTAGTSGITRIGALPIEPGDLLPSEVKTAITSSLSAADTVKALAELAANIYIAGQLKAAAPTFYRAVKTLTLQQSWLTKFKVVYNTVKWVEKAVGAYKTTRVLTVASRYSSAAAKVATTGLKYGKLLTKVGHVLGVIGVLVDLGFAGVAFAGYIAELGWSFEGVLRGTLAALPALIGVALGVVALLATNPVTIAVAIVLAIVLGVLTFIFGDEINEFLQGVGDWFIGKDYDEPITDSDFVVRGIRPPEFLYKDPADDGLTAGDEVVILVEMRTRAWGGPIANHDPSVSELVESELLPSVESCTDYDVAAKACAADDIVDPPDQFTAKLRTTYDPIYEGLLNEAGEPVTPAMSCSAWIAAAGADGSTIPDPATCTIEWLWIASNHLPVQRATVNSTHASRVAYTGQVRSRHCSRPPMGSCTWSRTWLPTDGETEWQPIYFDVLPATLDGFLGWEEGGTPVLVELDGDHDGLTDAEEAELGTPTDPALLDTDGDGLDDGFESAYGGADGALDPTDPDSDDDGLSDREEIRIETDPREPDTDHDGLTDAEEVAGWTIVFFHGGEVFEMPVASDPRFEDIDGDGIGDMSERDGGTNPRAYDSDEFTSCDRLQPSVSAYTGTRGDDRIVGTSGDDVIDGRGGNDIVCAFGGTDTLVLRGGDRGSYSGGAGIDIARIQTADDLDLDAAMVSTALGTATLESVERASVSWRRNAVHGGTVDARDWVKALWYANLCGQRVVFLGGAGRDRATGGAGVDVLRGSGGDDVLRGMAGDDTLIGGRGFDFCDGGSGKNLLRTCER